MEENKNPQPRKQYAKRGEKTSKMMTFRLDAENLEWLNTQPNKGLYINNLIRADRQKRSYY